MVAVGGDCSVPGEVHSTTILNLNRNSRYLFVILDIGGDGICCNNGPEGYYKIYMDNILQVKGGTFKESDTVVFGAYPGPTSKPTNVVRRLHCCILLTPYSFLNVHYLYS